MNETYIKRRVRAISGELKKNGIECLIITKPANVSYTTGFLGKDSWVMIINGRSYLLTDSRYTEQVQNECPVCSIIERHEPLSQAAAKIIKKYKSAEIISANFRFLKQYFL
jgi:Xaa-Pro aminopeptidase